MRLKADRAVYASPSVGLTAVVTAHATGLTFKGPEVLTSVDLSPSPSAWRMGETQLRAEGWTIQLREGENLLRVEASAEDGGRAVDEIRLVLDTKPPEIEISSPPQDSVLSVRSVDVFGTVKDDTGVASVTLDGTPVLVAGGQFRMRALPLMKVNQEFVFEATDLAGNKSRSTLRISSSAPVPAPREFVLEFPAVMESPVALRLSPQVGPAPLEVVLTPSSAAPGDLQRVEYDFDGDGGTDLVRKDLEPITHRYEGGGIFYPVVTVVTGMGSFSSFGGRGDHVELWSYYYARVRPWVRVYAPPRLQKVIPLVDPQDLTALSDGSLIATSGAREELVQFDREGRRLRSLRGGPIQGRPTGVAVDTQGRVYVVLKKAHQVVRLTPEGDSFAPDPSFGEGGRVGGRGSGKGQLDSPSDVAVDNLRFPGPHTIYVSDTGNRRIQTYGLEGQVLGPLGADQAPVISPVGVDLSSRRLYVADPEAQRILGKPRRPGALKGTSEWEPADWRPAWVSCGYRTLVSDTRNNRVYIFSSSESRRREEGNEVTRSLLLREFGEREGLSSPGGVSMAFDAFYVADTGNDRVLRFAFPELLEEGSPAEAWARFKAALRQGHLEEALACLSSSPENAPARDALLQMPPSALRRFGERLGELRAQTVYGNDGRYYEYASSYMGEKMNPAVEFIPVGGRWLISRLTIAW